MILNELTDYLESDVMVFRVPPYRKFYGNLSTASPTHRYKMAGIGKVLLKVKFVFIGEFVINFFLFCLKEGGAGGVET